MGNSTDKLPVERKKEGKDLLVREKSRTFVRCLEEVCIGIDKKEKKMSKIIDDLSRLDVNTVTLSIKNHVLHHPSSEDLMQMINLMNPKYYFPIKGEYRYQYMNAAVAEKAGMDVDNILLKLNGDVINIENGKVIDNDIIIHLK